ncbi:MAG: helix-turn-helix transcriptional regulator [Nitrospirota bacterium]
MRVNQVLKKIREIRKAKGIKQGRIAEELGIDRTSYSKKEIGKVPLSLDELLAIMQLLDIEWHDLFSGLSPKLLAIRTRLETIKTFPHSAQIDFTDYEEALKRAAEDIEYLLLLVDAIASQNTVKLDTFEK